MELRTMLLFAAALLLVFPALGCGGRTLTGVPGDGGTHSNNNNVNNNLNNNVNNNNNNNAGECQSADDCSIATKWDQCCACPEPASAQDLARDPCLIPIEQSYIPPQCIVDCPAVECPPCPDWGKSLACLWGECEWAEGHCTRDTECIAAIRVDNCCQPAIPATHDDVDSDPCLVYWPIGWEGIPQECFDLWDPQCALIDCAPWPPASRAMECEQNMCGYVPECERQDDCTLLVDHRQCCPCPEAWPSSMSDHDPCLLPKGAYPPGDCIPDACDGVMCEQCPPDPVVNCSHEETCVGNYWYEQ